MEDGCQEEDEETGERWKAREGERRREIGEEKGLGKRKWGRGMEEGARAGVRERKRAFGSGRGCLDMGSRLKD